MELGDTLVSVCVRSSVRARLCLVLDIARQRHVADTWQPRGCHVSNDVARRSTF
ncbi:hypothetical protein Tco_0518534, partial [Tanacetum coccineum]